MAYNYIGLVNDVNRRLNEVELQEKDFPNAIGEYGAVKEAVNSAIRYINQHEFEWPFNHVEMEEKLIEGQVRYAYPDEAKTVNMDSFRIKRNKELNVSSKKLEPIAYQEYLNKFVDLEYNDSDSIKGVPDYVFRTPNQQFGVINPPNAEYDIVYEYYRLPVDLIKHDDVPSIPEQFRSVIVNGSMHFAYMFGGDQNESGAMQERFKEEIKNMRALYINRFEYLRSTVLGRHTYTTTLRVS